MKGNRLLKVLNSLSKKEIALLEQFIQSPIHNKNDLLIRLFIYLTKGDHSLKLEKVFRHLYPKATFDAQKIHHLNSYLLKIVEEFLAWQEWKSEELSQQLYLLRAYHKRHLNQAFERVLKQSSRSQKQNKLRNAAFYHNQYQLKFENYQFAHNSGRSKDVQLHDLSFSLDLSFCIEKLRIACFQLSHMAFVQTDYESRLLEAVLQFVEDQKLQSVQAVAVYYYAFKALANLEEEQYFIELKKILEKHAIHFTLTELKDIYLLAINYCIRRINKNDQQYISEVFDLYKLGLANEVLLDHKILSRWTYNNIIVAGLKLNQFDWVEQFIHHYKNMLAKEHREGSFNYNLAKYHFEKGAYKTAMPLLLRMEYDDLLHNLGARTMLLKMYYELEEFDALDTFLMSFKAYIMRKKVYGYHRENYLNIIRFAKKLAQLNPYDAPQKQMLKEAISTTEKLTEKEWLLRELEKL